MTGRMLEGIETLIQQERPDWVLVYGDTNSTLAGAGCRAVTHIGRARRSRSALAQRCYARGDQPRPHRSGLQFSAVPY